MDAPSPPARKTLFVFVAVLPALVIAAIQVSWAWPFFTDDALITLRFVDRLLAGDGLTWTDGERVEGSSNHLWMLGCALLGACGVDLVTAARALGALCTAAALWLLAAAGRPHDARTTLGAAVAPLLVASTTQVMVWTLGGMEGPLVLLLLAWGGTAVVRLVQQRPDGAWSARDLQRCGLPFALLCLTRADGPLWAGATGLGLLLSALRLGLPAAIRRAFWFGLPALLAFAALSTFRVVYYGDFVPNIGRVKIGFSDQTWRDGLHYVGEVLWVDLGLAAAALLATILLLRRPRSASPVVLLLVPAAAWLLYLASIGGDHFAGYRLGQPALAPLALLVAFAIPRLAEARAATAAVVAVALLGTAGNVAQSRTAPLSVWARSETWEWQGKVIGEVLGRAFGGQRARIAVDAAGAVPYYSRLPALDMLGLCDRTIARTPVPAFAAAAARAGGLVRSQGHMHGNGAYVMDQAPDLMMFANPPCLPLPVFVSGLELEADRRFLDGYRCAVLETEPIEWLAGVTAPIQAVFWVRIDGKAGVRRSNERLDVPAFLLGAFHQHRPIQCRYERQVGTPEAAAREQAEGEALRWFGERSVAAVPAADGALQLELRASKPARLEVAVPEGTWRLELQPAGTGLVAALEGATAGADGTTFTVAAGASTAVVVTAPATVRLPVRLATVSLHRVR